MTINRMTDIDLSGKRVLIREDLNVPVRDGKVTSDARLRASLPTIRDKDSLLYYKEAIDGQILEEGITEAGSMVLADVSRVPRTPRSASSATMPLERPGPRLTMQTPARLRSRPSAAAMKPAPASCRQTTTPMEFRSTMVEVRPI